MTQITRKITIEVSVDLPEPPGAARAEAIKLLDKNITDTISECVVADALLEDLDDAMPLYIGWDSPVGVAAKIPLTAARPNPQLVVDIDEFKELFGEAMSTINSRNLADYDDVAEALFTKMTKDPTDICDQVKADLPDLNLAEACEVESMIKEPKDG